MSRSIITIEDLSNSDIERIFVLADEYLDGMRDPNVDYRVRGKRDEGAGFLISTLFYEPSTRTKFSFETAMLRLGGQVLASDDPATTSVSKGETLADTVRVIQNYADAIILRHPAEGAARLASEYSDVPVINAGDGGHEHPTQTLCDLYTLRREKTSLADLNVLICGDLKNGRTTHSLVYALARFGANIVPLAAPGLELPDHVARRLEWEYGCVPHKIGKKDGGELPVDVVYVTPQEPHQQALFPEVKVDVHVALAQKALSISKIDVCYVTRLQKERLAANGDRKDAYPTINQEFLSATRFANTRVLHPLPRVDELGYDLDEDKRSAYFKQAAYGVPVRMALLAALLKIRPDSLGDRDANARYDNTYKPRKGIVFPCPNDRCISRSKVEHYVLPKFWIVNRRQVSFDQRERPLTVRCVYCEHDVTPPVIGNAKLLQYSTNPARWYQIPFPELVLFVDEEQAKVSGFRAVGVDEPALV